MARPSIAIQRLRCKLCLEPADHASILNGWNRCTQTCMIQLAAYISGGRWMAASVLSNMCIQVPCKQQALS